MGANDELLRVVATDERFLPTFSYYGKTAAEWETSVCDDRIANAEEAPYPLQIVG